MLSQTAIRATLLATLATLASSHSWVEEVYRIAPNGTMVGAVGYPRGWVARTSTDPLWKDAIPQWLLPLTGQPAYSGDEVLNKYDFTADPQFPMLQAAGGDHIALIHLENGHTTLPQNQPLKPRNRGTIYFYGTAEPKPKERLFDVHLVWNRDGTGGDKRGRLLGTRNYDDGQCYQPNPGELSQQRASELASDGAVHDRELRCQSDIQLPDDLKPGSTYTIYWYWDWPDLNADKIDLDATKNGVYPWAGTFMRGEKDPHGFTMAAIAKNESYASTVDIKIVDRPQLGNMAKAVAGEAAWKDDQDIYRMAIKEQMSNNFQVDVDANKPAGDDSGSEPAPSASSSAGAPAPTSSTPAGPPPGVTVTKTVTVPPSTVISTVYVTKSDNAEETTQSSNTAPTSTFTQPSSSTESSTSTQPSSSAQSSVSGKPSKPPTEAPAYASVTVPASGAGTGGANIPSGTASNGSGFPNQTPIPGLRARAVRRHWGFGQ